jgi:hypothetical protein
MAIPVRAEYGKAEKTGPAWENPEAGPERREIVLEISYIENSYRSRCGEMLNVTALGSYISTTKLTLELLCCNVWWCLL